MYMTLSHSGRLCQLLEKLQYNSTVAFTLCMTASRILFRQIHHKIV